MVFGYRRRVVSRILLAARVGILLTVCIFFLITRYGGFL